MRLIHISKLLPEKGIPYCEQHIRKLIKAGKFPQPIRCGKLTTFDEGEIDAHLEAMKAERDRKAEEAA